MRGRVRAAVRGGRRRATRANERAKLGQRRATPRQRMRVGVRDEPRPPARAVGVEPLVEAEAGEPCRDRPGAERRARRRRRPAGTGAPRAANRRAGRRRAARRTTRAGRGTAGSSAGRRAARRPSPMAAVAATSSRWGTAGTRFCSETAPGVHVRERLVALVHGQREQGEQARGAARSDRGQKPRRVADLPRHRDHRAEREERDRRDEVAEAGAPETRGAGARETGVVGHERGPRDDAREHEVEAGPERVRAGSGARAPGRPGRAATTSRGRRARRSPPRPRTCGRSGGRSRPGRATRAAVAITPKRIFQNAAPPNPKTCSESALAPVAITISSNTDQPRHWRMLRPVGRYDPRRPSGARWSTIAGTPASAPIRPPMPSIRFPTTAAATIAASCHRQREPEPVLRGREHEERPGHDHEERDRQVRPEQEAVERPEQPEPPRDRLDSPLWCVLHTSPFAGMTRIRFDGCDLSRLRGTPVSADYPGLVPR